MCTIIPDSRPSAEAPRSLHQICEDARRGQCDYCSAMPGEPCAFSGTGPDGYHVARFTWARAHDLISVLDVGAVLWTVAATPFTTLTVIYDPGGAGQDDDDDLEPYCAECGAWIGRFLGLDGWRHFRGDPAPGGKRELYDGGHDAVVAWCEPPGRAISPAEAAVLGQALADAERYRRRRVEDWCADCAGAPAEACDGHLDDLDQADAYAELGRQLQQEADR